MAAAFLRDVADVLVKHGVGTELYPKLHTDRRTPATAFPNRHYSIIF